MNQLISLSFLKQQKTNYRCFGYKIELQSKCQFKIRWSVIDKIMYKKAINLWLPVGVLRFCKNNENYKDLCFTSYFNYKFGRLNSLTTQKLI